MGNHTKFASSDEEDEKVKRSPKRKEEKKHDRERSPQKEKRRDETNRRHEDRPRDRDYEKRRNRGDEDRRRDDRRRDWDRNSGRDFRKDRGDRGRNDKSWEPKLSKEEIDKQRKMLWSKKSVPAETSGEASSSSAPAPKNASLWSSAISASGADGQQVNKFMRLMGVKNADAGGPKDSEKLKEERNKQSKLLSDLDKQYQTANKAQLGRGMGLGFQ